MDLWQRRSYSVIHYSNQSCSYNSIVFGKLCKEAGVRPSDPTAIVSTVPCARAYLPA